MPATNGMRAAAPSHAPTLPKQLTVTSTAATTVSAGQPARPATWPIACITPDDALTALGQTLQKKNDDQAAVVEFQKARRINPSGPAASLGLATSLEKVGRIDDALKEFRLYLEIEPPPPDADKVRAHLALLSRSKPQVK